MCSKRPSTRNWLENETSCMAISKRRRQKWNRNSRKKRERNFRRKKQSHMDVPTTIGDEKVEEIKIRKNSCERSVCAESWLSRVKRRTFLLRFFIVISVYKLNTKIHPYRWENVHIQCVWRRHSSSSVILEFYTQRNIFLFALTFAKNLNMYWVEVQHTSVTFYFENISSRE